MFEGFYVFEGAEAPDYWPSAGLDSASALRTRLVLMSWDKGGVRGPDFTNR